jgi:hypothetical protein
MTAPELPAKLLAFAAETFAPLHATWRALDPWKGGYPRVIGTLPNDSGTLDLISNPAQTGLVKLYLTSTLDGEYGERFVYVLAKCVPGLSAAQADSFLAQAMRQMQQTTTEAESLQVNHRIGRASIELLWMRKLALLALIISY